MPADTTVKYFHADQVGAPTLHGNQGSLIAVLDACLQDGFGLKSVDSLVVADGIATATITTGHGFDPDMVGLIAGVTPSGLNGEKRVLSTSTTTLTYDATGVPDGVATGTITIKVAPLGWAKVFSTTNLAVYRASSPEGTRMYLRVDETADGREARVRGYESMTDATTGTGPFPTTGQQTNGVFWPKATAAGTSKRQWTIIGDHRTLYLHMSTVDAASNPTGALAAGCVWQFGDIKSFRAGDPYSSALCGTTSGQYGSTAAQGGSVEHASNNFGTGNPRYLPRPYTGISGSSIYEQMFELAVSTGAVSGTGGLSVSYPNGPDNSLILSRAFIAERSPDTLRGRTRGVYRTPQTCHAAFSQRDKITGTGDLVGRKLLAVKCGAPASTASAGVLFFDITGPWEA